MNSWREGSKPVLINVRSSQPANIGRSRVVIGSPVRRGSAHGARRRCATLGVRKTIYNRISKQIVRQATLWRICFAPAAGRDLSSRVEYRTDGWFKSFVTGWIESGLLRLP